jgi:glycine cleavage system T protein (aminomethyltransferase)
MSDAENAATTGTQDEEERHYSPLHAWHEAHGAEYLWEDGWPWTMHEGADPMSEYEAIRTSTGIWDLFSTCKYEVTGPDAARLVQRRFTNAVADMRPGQARYGAFVDANGSMVDDGNAYRYADDRFILMINTPTLEDWFRETAGDLDASITHRTEDFGMIAVQGPTAEPTLQPLTDRDLGELRYFRFWPEPTKVAGVDAWVQRTGFSGEKGYEILMAPADAQTVWDALLDAGGTPFGLTAVDLARTEVGLIIIAVDYNPGELSPYDLSMDRFVKTDTECVGAAALAAYGTNAPKRFKTLRIESEVAPEYGAAVTRDGRQVGTVTSPAVSPRVGTIGLAILEADASNDGTKVEVAMGDETVPASVDVLSVLDPDKERPRS